MTRSEAIRKAINMIVYLEAHFAKSKEARKDAEEIIEALEQINEEEPVNKLTQQAYEDGMTHKENIRAILECYFTGYKEEIIDSACNRISELKPKTGHWIDGFGGSKCSECGCLEAGHSDYYPNCGAKMLEVEE